ncbi:MAG: prolyl oligopeptidase family serine peptidase, partial [Planctomycetota bacterium]|nr:prolyl oligopeptidase family serine peptidase [Planctomycetota bacterium]
MQNPIPLEDFFRKPDRAQLRLSPDGRFLGWLEPAKVDGKRRMNVFVTELPAPLDADSAAVAFGAARQLTAVSSRDVAGFFFADDEHVVFAQDQGGDENHHLFCVRADGSEPLGEARDLTPFDGVKCSIVDDLEDLPGQLLFQMNRDNPEVFDVYHLELSSGALRVVGQNPGNIQQWQTDHQGRLRVAVTTDGVNNSLLYRATEDDEWRCLATYDFKENAAPLGFTYDDAALWVSSNLGRDKRAIFEFDLETGRAGELIFEHPDVDVSVLLRSRRREKTVGVAYETDRVHHEFWDARRAALQDFLDAELPGRRNNLTSFDRSEQRYVVHSGSDCGPGSYHLLDAPFDPADEGSTERFALTPLFELAPWLDEGRLVPMAPVAFDARDGLHIPGYLSLPAGRSLGDGGARLPLIVNPHGGPWVRDSWGYNPEVQFLCSRGYAVLQINYRGSAGVGRRYLEARFGQWGRAMQDDITDGVAW